MLSSRVSLDEAKRRIHLVHADTVKLVEFTYVSCSNQALFHDEKYGFWISSVKQVALGKRHTAHRSFVGRNSRRHTLEDLERKIEIVHNGKVRLKEGQTYVHSHTKMWFIDDEYGEWFALPYIVAMGHGHPKRGTHNAMSKMKRSVGKFHWRTNEKLICVGSYEAAFVDWCNRNQIDFDWQIPYRLPNKKVYWIDAYVKSGKLAGNWIEIKGTFNRKNGHVGKEKWELFNSIHKNSILLFREDLLELGIQVR